MNAKTGKLDLTYVYKYPRSDAQGNWLERDTHIVKYEFGKQTLGGLMGMVKRVITYRK